MEYEYLYHQQAPWPPRSGQGHDVSHGAYDRCWPISRERHVLETQKLIERLHSAHPTGSSFKAKDGVRRPVSQTSVVTRPVTAETETVSYLYRTGRPTNFRIGTPVEHALSTVTPSYKSVTFGSCTRMGAYRVGTRPHSAATQFVLSAERSND